MILANPFQRFAAISWFVLVVVNVLAAWAQEPEFDSSLISLLPDSEQQPVVQKATDALAKSFDEKLVLLLQGDNSEQLQAYVTEVATTFERLTYVDEVQWRTDAQAYTHHQTQYEAYRFTILSPDVTQRMLSGEFELIRKKALTEALSPMSASNLSVVEDPFGLNRDYLRWQEQSALLEIENGFFKVKSKDIPTYLVVVSFNHSPFDPALQSSVLMSLEEISEVLTAQNIKLWRSGMVLHAAAGAKQANSEISTIGLGSLVGIILSILFVFRKAFPVFLLLLPVAVGSATAFAVSILVFERVHLITIAFGAGLIGVSIDYALHFLCERHIVSAKSIVRKLLPGMLLGLLSSVLAYSAQALAPFPGLRQMALFSVVGLISAWLTVMLWFPWLTSQMRLKPLVMAEKLDRLKAHFPNVETNAWLKYGLLMAFFFTVFTVYHSEKSVDIRALQTSSAALLEEDLHVQNILGITSSAKFLLVTGDSLEESLQIEESLTPLLNEMRNTGLIEGYRALSQQLPSLQQQRQNLALAHQLYEEELDRFFTDIGLGRGFALKSQSTLLDSGNQFLKYNDWLKIEGNSTWSSAVIASENQLSTVIRLQGQISPEVSYQLQILAAENEHLEYIDQVAAISGLLKRYQEQIFYWVVAAYIVIAAVLFVRYRLDCWRILSPPLIACFSALSVVALMEGSLNIFHLMAMILVIGIGLDLGIFMAENNESPHTWLASSLSCYTSLLAFGLLAVSETKILHHFGATVLIGLLCVWLLAPVVRRQGERTVAYSSDTREEKATCLDQ